MLNLLSAVVNASGNPKSRNVNTTIFWLVLAQVAIIAAAATIVVYLLQQRKAKRVEETAAAEPVVAIDQPAIVDKIVEHPVVMEQAQVQRNPNYVTEDFYVPYEGILEPINKGLIMHEIRSSDDEATFEINKSDDE